VAKNNFKILGHRAHAKASEEYIDVIFDYKNGQWNGSIPIKYRRTGVDLSNETEISEHIDAAYEDCRPEKRTLWLKEQKTFWEEKDRADVTKGFFDALSCFHWCCVSCDLPANPNWARRTQDLKEFGYTLATNTSMLCNKCKTKGTHLLLVPLPRGGKTGYESWSPALRKRIISAHKNFDAYEGKEAAHLLPDHKFPEIRWDNNTRRDNLEDMTDEEILTEFQLLTNQRNQQKREVCRACFQTGKRGYPFGIDYFYSGGSDWPRDVQKIGKEAMKGCIGCGWYDINAWRRAVIKLLHRS